MWSIRTIHLKSSLMISFDIKVRGNSPADPSKRAYRLKFGKDEKDKVTGKLIRTHSMI